MRLPATTKKEASIMHDTAVLKAKAQPVGKNRKRYKWNPLKLLRNIGLGILLLLASIPYTIMLLWIADWWVNRPVTF